MKELDILPQLDFSSDEVQENNLNDLKSIFNAISPKQYAKEQIAKENVIYQNGTDGETEWIPPEESDVFHLPFFFK